MTMLCCLPTRDSSQTLLLKDRSPDNNGDTTDITDSSPTTRSKILGYTLLVISVATFVFGVACAQILAKSVPHSELNGLRFAAQFVLISPFVMISKCDVRIERDLIGWVILLSVLNTCQSYSYYGMAYYLPLGVAAGTQQSIIVILVCVITCVTQKKLTWHEPLAVLLCVSGVMMVTQPGMLAPEKGANLTANTSDVTDHPTCARLPSTNMTFINASSADVHTAQAVRVEITIGYTLCMMGAVAMVMEMYTIKNKLAHIRFDIVCFWDAVIGMTISFVIMSASESPYLPGLGFCRGILAAHMLFAVITTVFYLISCQRTDPLVNSLVCSFSIVGTFVLQFTVLSDILPGNTNDLAIWGIVVVVIGNMIVPSYNLIYSC